MEDELVWLRKFEQLVQEVNAHWRSMKYSEAGCCVAELRQEVNQRIIEVLETRTESAEDSK